MITTHHRRRRQLAALQQDRIYPHLTWIELRPPSEARALLAALREPAAVVS